MLEFSHAEHDLSTDEIHVGDVLWLAVMTKEKISTTEEGEEPTEETSGWNFQAFDGEKQVLSSENCFSCHKEQENNDFVFFENN